MYARQKYVEQAAQAWQQIKDPVATKKYDGSHFFMEVQSDGSLKFYSRRMSVKGHYPERSSQLPHLTDKKLPHLAGHVYSVELIHTGKSKENKESHPAASGILNSLPQRAIETQKETGPIRAVLLDVINPPLPTYGDKIKHMEQVEKEFGKPEVLFVPKYEKTKAGIAKLLEQTKREGREGIIATSLTVPEPINPRTKIKHFDTYNLQISKILQEYDIHGNPKESMGAVECIDRSGRVVATVGTGWSREQRIDAWRNPRKWIGNLIQVKTMGWGSVGGKLRMPVYNGEPDGELDLIQ
jgi:hypothetical protein